MATKEERAAKRAAQAEKDRLMDEKLQRDYYDPDKRKRRRRNVRIGFCITLAILLVTSIVNWGVVSGWGNVQIERVNFSGNDGAHFSGLVYRPQNATDKTPAPAIIMLHGNAGNARNHESWAVEFSRRGFVVVVPDLYGAGDSQGYFDGTPTPSKKNAGATQPRALLEESRQFYNYMVNLPYVDTDSIIVSGHSMGASAACIIGAENHVKGILAASGTGQFFVTESSDPALAELWGNYGGNIAYVYGSVERWDTPENIAKSSSEMLGFLQQRLGDRAPDQLEIGKIYGSFEEGDGLVVALDQRIHEAAFVDPHTIGHLIEYGQDMIGDEVPNYLDPNNQVWMYKDYIGLFGIFAFAAFLFALALLLIEEVPVFAAVRRPLARNVGFRGAGLVIASLVGLLVPYLVMKTDAFGIVGGEMAYNLWSTGFNLGYANMGFGVIIGLTIVCVLGTILFLATEKKKKGLTLSDFGMTPANYDASASASAKAKSVVGMILRTLLLAAVVIGAGFAYTQLQSTVLGTDFYAWFFGVKDIPLDKIPSYLPYLGVFILAFVVLSIDMNVIRRLPSTGNETKDLIIAMAVNLVIGATVVIIVVAVKWYLQTMGDPADTNWLWSMGLDTQRIWGLPVGMGVATLGSTFIYKKTGNIWLCALLVGTLACLMGVLYGGARFHYLTYFYSA